jgi:uncharacterized membrane protein (UPF0182 family)
MPKDLQSHIRYPEDLFTLQMQMYATYTWRTRRSSTTRKNSGTSPRRPQDGRDRHEMEPYYTIMRLPARPKESSSSSERFNPSGATT